MDQIKIGKLIASERKAHQLTQAALGEKLGVSNKAVSKWENGRCLPDPSHYQALCEILEISLTELLCGEKITQDEALEKSDALLNDVLAHQHIYHIIDWIAYALFLVAAGCFLMPAIFSLSRSAGMMIVVMGFVLATIGMGMRLSSLSKQSGKKLHVHGLGLAGSLTVLFVGFKLSGVIDWPWLYVFSPVWLIYGGVLLLLLIIMIALFIEAKVFKKTKKKDKEDIMK